MFNGMLLIRSWLFLGLRVNRIWYIVGIAVVVAGVAGVVVVGRCEGHGSDLGGVVDCDVDLGVLNWIRKIKSLFSSHSRVERTWWRSIHRRTCQSFSIFLPEQ